MSSNDRFDDHDPRLDRVLSDIADSNPPVEAERSATDRVWTALQAELSQQSEASPARREIRDCAGFQSLLPAYLDNELPRARRLLFEDHVSECVPCRRALKNAKSAQRTVVSTRAQRPSNTWYRTMAGRVAAAALLFVTLYGLNIKTEVFSVETGGMIRIEQVEGQVMKVTDQGVTPVQPGEQIRFEDVGALRTARSASATFRLADNSLVEMNERAELAVSQKRKFWQRGDGDAVIDLSRGSIIVEASPQGSGHLFVDTNDCEVAVTGTVFAVNSGVKGSRVSVIEGEVHVAHSGDRDILNPGQQTTTNADLGFVPVADEIAWSKNLDRHLRVLIELSDIADTIDREVPGPALRYSTTLLDSAPADTVIFLGIPNITDMLGDAYDIVERKIGENELLSDWWQESMAGTETESALEEAMVRIRRYGDHLGDEIAVALPMRDGNVSEPVVYAELRGAESFAGYVLDDIQLLMNEENLDQAPIVVLEGDVPRPMDGQVIASSGQMFLWIHEGHVVLAPTTDSILEMAATLRFSGAGAFAGSAFHGRLAELYRDGAGLVVGMDLATLMSHENGEGDEEAMQILGFSDLQHVIAERQEKGDHTENRVVLTFDRPRQGVASWLAEPAPMGALDFISPNATIAAGFVMREPASVVDELFGFLSNSDDQFDERLDQFEVEQGFDIRNDIAAALGGEFALALDGPMLPNPSWKLIMEVYDPARLQATLETAALRLTELAGEHGAKGFEITSDTTGRRTYHEFRSLDTGLAAHYVFVDGYFVAGASRALIDRAIETRRSGLTLVTSPDFLDLLPTDGEVHFSGVAYHNLSRIVGPLSSFVNRSADKLPAEQRQLLEQLGASAKPSLTVAYGETERIELVNSTEGGFLGSAIGSFLRLDGLMSVQQLLGQAAASQGS